MPIIVADDPLSSVVLGSGRALDNLEILREIAID
jgi:rod shape-determining protein MreB